MPSLFDRFGLSESQAKGGTTDSPSLIICRDSQLTVRIRSPVLNAGLTKTLPIPGKHDPPCSWGSVRKRLACLRWRCFFALLWIKSSRSGAIVYYLLKTAVELVQSQVKQINLEKYAKLAIGIYIIYSLGLLNLEAVVTTGLFTIIFDSS